MHTYHTVLVHPYDKKQVGDSLHHSQGQETFQRTGTKIYIWRSGDPIHQIVGVTFVY
jgi:hypothetical protein